jgi:DNA invertase Pin-like site-specific DNA recombinase
LKKKQPNEQRITVLYARLSRDDEKEGISGSIQNQRAILEKFAADNHLPNPRFMFDDGYSGVTFARPAFMEIMELAEQGLVANLVVKDHSRLGRNRLVVGQLLEEDFVRLNVRYIAIMDNIDTANGVSDIVPMQDLFNEWHAKNTSDKVRRVMQSRGNAGIPLTTNVPYGYKKDPEDKTKWLVDRPAAEVVQRIFRMSVSGLGPTQIAKKLRSEGVLTPSEYLHSIGVNCPVKPPVYPHNWCSSTVAAILDRQEYTGDTVNFRSFRQSFKLKKRLDKPQEEWKIFPDTHPAIIDRETFALVQNLRQHRRRPTRTGIVSMFSGLLYCADCGSKLGYSATNNYKREQAFFFCSAYRGNSNVCSAHFIREKVVEELVLEGLQRLLWYIQVYEKRFAQEQMEHFGLQEKKKLTAKCRELDKAKQRVLEIDQLIQKSYEDMTKGLLSEERFATLTVSLENEQRQLKVDIPALEDSLNATADKADDLQKFIQRARQVTRLTELTPEIVHEFIDKIVVSKPEKIDGKRHQRVDIYYSTIGLWTAPEPETLEQEYMAYYQAMQKRKKRTA